MSDIHSPFNDPQAVRSYADRTAHLVPGFTDMQRMAMLLLAEHASEDAQVLVVGAGGGLELKLFAQAHPGWRFVGVDPSREMLQLARTTLGVLAERVHFHEALVESASAGPFDVAACLLTLHFLPAAERLHTLREIHRRLRPGAPLVVAHHSVPDVPEARARWLARYAAFAVSSGLATDKATGMAAALQQKLPMLSPEQDVALLQQAGFCGVQLFYAAFTFRGWVAYA